MILKFWRQRHLTSGSFPTFWKRAVPVRKPPRKPAYSTLRGTRNLRAVRVSAPGRDKYDSIACRNGHSAENGSALASGCTQADQNDRPPSMRARRSRFLRRNLREKRSGGAGAGKRVAPPVGGSAHCVGTRSATFAKYPFGKLTAPWRSHQTRRDTYIYLYLLLILTTTREFEYICWNLICQLFFFLAYVFCILNHWRCKVASSGN